MKCSRPVLTNALPDAAIVDWRLPARPTARPVDVTADRVTSEMILASVLVKPIVLHVSATTQVLSNYFPLPFWFSGADGFKTHYWHGLK